MRVESGLPYLNDTDLRYLTMLYQNRKANGTLESKTQEFANERLRIRNTRALLTMSGQSDIYFMPRPRDWELLKRYVKGGKLGE